MKAFPVYEALKDYFNVTLIHTGQHFDEKMNKVFFEQLNCPKPDINLNLEKKNRAGDLDKKLYIDNEEFLKDKEKVINELKTYEGNLGQLGEIRDKLNEKFQEIKPDMIMVFGDVTSTLAASLTAKNMGIKLVHVESGLRSDDIKMPEEVNRILTDYISDYCFCTEQSGIDNLKNEGIVEDKLFLVGNTLIDTQKKNLNIAMKTKYHKKLKLKEKEYVLITLHRPSNVDNLNKLKEIFDDLIELSKTEKIVYPNHPRTKKNLEKLEYLEKINDNKNIILEEPLGYLEFTCLLTNCKYIITDSGGLQEEATALDIPCFTLRENTERPSTLIKNNGTNQLINRINKIELKKCKGSMNLWDGESSEKIKNILIVFDINIIYDFLLNGDIHVAEKMLNNVLILAKTRHYGEIQLENNFFEKPLDVDNYGKFLFYSFRPFCNLLYSFKKTGCIKYILFLKKQIKYYLINCNEPEHSSKKHANAFRCIMLTFIFNLLKKLNLLEKDMEEDIKNDLVKLSNIIGIYENFEYHDNHGITQTASLLYFGYEFKHNKSINSGIQFLNKIVELIDDDGVLIENSPYYHYYSMVMFFYIDIYLKKKNKKFNSLNKIEKMLEYATYIVKPSGFIPLIGSSLPRKIPYYEKKLLNNIGEYNPEFQFVRTYGKKGKHLKPHKSFPISGFIILRSSNDNYINQTYISFQLTEFRSLHSHLDCMNLIIYSNNNDIVVDSGLYAYTGMHPSAHNFNDFDKNKTYFISSKAHNVVLIDEENQPIKFDEIKIGPHVSNKNYVYQSGIFLYDGKHHERQIFLYGNNLILVRDILKSSEKHNYKQLWHTNNKLKKLDNNNWLMLNDNSVVCKITNLNLNIKSNTRSGFYSKKLNERIENNVLYFEKNSTDFEFLTVFTLGNLLEDILDFNYNNNEIVIKGNKLNMFVNMDVKENNKINLSNGCSKCQKEEKILNTINNNNCKICQKEN
jgi:UDP-N-acetylglucosamine 2-epimerase (non-hydrolysing)